MEAVVGIDLRVVEVAEKTELDGIEPEGLLGH
jgi:hypothetical protein